MVQTALAFDGPNKFVTIGCLRDRLPSMNTGTNSLWNLSDKSGGGLSCTGVSIYMCFEDTWPTSVESVSDNHTFCRPNESLLFTIYSSSTYTKRELKTILQLWVRLFTHFPIWKNSSHLQRACHVAYNTPPQTKNMRALLYYTKTHPDVHKHPHRLNVHTLDNTINRNINNVYLDWRSNMDTCLIACYIHGLDDKQNE